MNNLTEDQQYFLSQNGIDYNDIIDCNPEESQITMKDGRVRTITEIYTRCMGYFRPVTEFNKGKKQEFADRKTFTEKTAMQTALPIAAE